MKTIAILIAAAGLAAGAATAQQSGSTVSGRIGGGAATEQGSSTIKGRVGGAAATDAGATTIRQSGTSGESTRPGLSGDPFSSRGAVVGGTNLLGSTNDVIPGATTR